MHIDIGTTRTEFEFDEEHPNPDAPKEAEHVDEAEPLYFFENLSVPRLEGRFETPLGYWSTDPDASTGRLGRRSQISSPCARSGALSPKDSPAGTSP